MCYLLQLQLGLGEFSVYVRAAAAPPLKLKNNLEQNSFIFRCIQLYVQQIIQQCRGIRPSLIHSIVFARRCIERGEPCDRYINYNRHSCKSAAVELHLMMRDNVLLCMCVFPSMCTCNEEK